jgi:hypothetical protein
VLCGEILIGNGIGSDEVSHEDRAVIKIRDTAYKILQNELLKIYDL